jgi:hypothetical protein
MEQLNGYRMRLVLVGIVAAIMLGGENVKADFTFSTPIELGPSIWSPGHDPQGCCFSRDGLELYFSSNRPGGYGAKDIWVATRETKDAEWSDPANLGPTVNSQQDHVEPAISPDGLELYFRTWNPWNTYVCTRPSKVTPWSKPELVEPPINSGGAISPEVSADGLSLYFGSQRTGGYGGLDIWVSKRTINSDSWGEPTNLGPNVNSNRGDAYPSISNDGLVLFFASIRGGEWNLWMTQRATETDPWEPPVNCHMLNNALSDWIFDPAISPDGSVLYFERGYDMWQSTITPIVDLNGDGIVDAADMCVMVDYWGTDNSLCDIGPMPWGDGIVDVQDLIVLSEHLFEDYRLVAHWALDEDAGDTAYDMAGENDATLQGGPIWQPEGGKVGGSLQFDGIDDYISTLFILNPAKGSFSVSAWIKGGAPGQVMISQRDVGRDPGNAWLLADASYGRLMTRLMHPPFPPLVSESVITDDQWHHVGLVFDLIALHRCLYVDGTEVAKDSDLVGGVGSDGGLHIGADKTLDAASYFSGLIDDVRIYNNVLTAEEIAALAQ